MSSDAVERMKNKGSIREDPSNTVTYKHFVAPEVKKARGIHKLRMPTLNQLLCRDFQKQTAPSCAVAARARELHGLRGNGRREIVVRDVCCARGGGEAVSSLVGALMPSLTDMGWQVLYVDGEMHIADIQERARQLRGGMPKLDKGVVDKNLSFLARQHQDAGVLFPSITEVAGQRFVLDQVEEARRGPRGAR